MNRTIKDATVQRFHDDNHDRLRQHLVDFVSVYEFARRLKTLKKLTPHISAMLDIRTRTFRLRPHPSNAGTEHLGERSDPGSNVRESSGPPPDHSAARTLLPSRPKTGVSISIDRCLTTGTQTPSPAKW
jgi:hypothetical protein